MGNKPPGRSARVVKRKAKVQFYVDADVLGLAHVLAKLRPDVTYPGDPGGEVNKRVREACPIVEPATGDLIWIPETARLGWIAITRDAAIQRRVPELEAARASGARLVVLAGNEARTTWLQLEVLMSRWREIEALTDREGPFVVNVTRAGKLRDVDLDELSSMEPKPVMQLAPSRPRRKAIDAPKLPGI